MPVNPSASASTAQASTDDAQPTATPPARKAAAKKSAVKDTLSVAKPSKAPPLRRPGVPTVGLSGFVGKLEPTLAWKADHKTQRGSWWPMFSWGVPRIGNDQHNHWAKGGPCERYDLFTGAQSQTKQARERYRSTQQLGEQLLGIGDRWDVLNAGHCNQEAMRCAWFDEPTRSVSRLLHGTKTGPLPVRLLRQYGALDNTVTLRPSDIKGLMVLCMDDLVDASKGNGGFEYCGFRYLGPEQTKDTLPQQHDLNDPLPHEVFERVVKDWGMGRKLAIIADRKTSELVDNRLFDGGKVEHLQQPPYGLAPHVIPEGGSVRYYRFTLTSSASPEHVVRLFAWKHTADDGTVSSNWIVRGKGSGLVGHALDSVNAVRNNFLGHAPGGLTENPDFYWIAHLKEDYAKGAPWVGFADKTNPEVDMFEVWKLYVESIGKNWQQIAKKWPDHVKAHEALLLARSTTRNHG